MNRYTDMVNQRHYKTFETMGSIYCTNCPKYYLISIKWAVFFANLHQADLNCLGQNMAGQVLSVKGWYNWSSKYWTQKICPVIRTWNYEQHNHILHTYTHKYAVYNKYIQITLSCMDGIYSRVWTTKFKIPDLLVSSSSLCFAPQLWYTMKW
jgi:hypothetical protein